MAVPHTLCDCAQDDPPHNLHQYYAQADKFVAPWILPSGGSHVDKPPVTRGFSNWPGLLIDDAEESARFLVTVQLE